MVEMAFLLAPTVPSPPRPQILPVSYTHLEGRIEHPGDSAAVDAALLVDLPVLGGEGVGDSLRLVIAAHQTRGV